jgi:hypothetical protein
MCLSYILSQVMRKSDFIVQVRHCSHHRCVFTYDSVQQKCIVDQTTEEGNPKCFCHETETHIFVVLLLCTQTRSWMIQMVEPTTTVSQKEQMQETQADGNIMNIHQMLNSSLKISWKIFIFS